MLYLSFLTPNTCWWTPSTPNLVNTIATFFKQLYTTRSLHVRGRSFVTLLFHKFQKLLCIGASYSSRDRMNKLHNQSKAPSYLVSETWVYSWVLCVGETLISGRVGETNKQSVRAAYVFMQPQKSTRPLVPIQPIVKKYRNILEMAVLFKFI